MVKELTMPKLGLTMEKGVVVSWKKRVGDKIESGEVIAEVGTDKSVVEFESPLSGYLRSILVAEGESANVGALLGYVTDTLEEEVPGGGGEAKVETKPASAPQEAAHAASEAVAAPKGKVKAAPAARKLAEKLGVDLNNVVGTGPGGRIASEDVKKASEASVATSAPAPTPAAAPLAPKVGQEKISTMRKVIAQKMLQSTQNIPQYFISVDVDVSKLQVRLDMSVEEIKQSHNVKPTFTDLMVKAIASTLKEFPEVNAYFIDNNGDMSVQYNEEVNVGIAVAINDGLIVPVVKNADKLALPEIAQKRKELVDKARKGRLSPDEYTGGTFTISNLGPMGIDHFQAIINPPESAILAVGTTKKKPVVIGEGIAIRPIMNLSLTSDHRILDGATAAKFLRRLCDRIEAGEVGI